MDAANSLKDFAVRLIGIPAAERSRNSKTAYINNGCTLLDLGLRLLRRQSIYISSEETTTYSNLNQGIVTVTEVFPLKEPLA